MAGIEPLMGPESYKSYVLSQPLATHWRAATCEEVGCPDYAKGWQVRVEGLPAELLAAAKASGRQYQEVPVKEGETWLVFPAGQPCFQASRHRAPAGRPPLYLVRDGDHRGNPRGTKYRQHLRPALWVEDFAEHQDKLADAQKRG
jgi:hypothetical protein